MTKRLHKQKKVIFGERPPRVSALSLKKNRIGYSYNLITEGEMFDDSKTNMGSGLNSQANFDQNGQRRGSMMDNKLNDDVVSNLGGASSKQHQQNNADSN